MSPLPAPQPLLALLALIRSVPCAASMASILVLDKPVIRLICSFISCRFNGFCTLVTAECIDSPAGCAEVVLLEDLTDRPGGGGVRTIGDWWFATVVFRPVDGFELFADMAGIGKLVGSK